MLNRIGSYIWDATPEEIAEAEAANQECERQYWQSIGYDDAVDAEIRKRYLASQEFATLRQKDEKPDEYQEYFNYCEECKSFVKAKIAEVVNDSFGIA
jgi:hypothetical protein